MNKGIVQRTPYWTVDLMDRIQTHALYMYSRPHIMIRQTIAFKISTFMKKLFGGNFQFSYGPFSRSNFDFDLLVYCSNSSKAQQQRSFPLTNTTSRLGY